MAEQKGVFVKFGVDTKDLDKGVKDAKEQIGSLGKELREGVNTFGKWAGAATAAGAAIAAGIMKHSIDAAKELENLSRVAGASLADFQKMAYGARSVGIEQEKMADILKDVKDRVGDFISTGAGPMADFFERIAPKVGVTAESFRNLSGPDALGLFVSSLEKANLSQAEMTFFMEAMASDSTRLLPLLLNNADAMARQAAEAEKLGLIISDIDNKKLVQASAAMGQFGKITESFTSQLSAKFAPAIQTALNLLTNFIEESGGLGNVAEQSFNKIVNAAAFVMDAVDGLQRVFSIAADSIIVFVTKIGGAILENVGRPIRLLVEGLSALPGEFGEQAEQFKSQYDTFFKDLDAVAAEAGKNISDTLTAPLAGEEFKARIQAAVEQSTKAAADAVAAETGNTSFGSGMAVFDPKAEGKEDEAQARRDEIAQKLEDMQAGFMSEQELIFADAEEKFRIAEEARAIGLLSEELYSEQIKEIIRKRNGELGKLDMERAERAAAIAKQEQMARKQATQTMFNDLTTLMNSGSKRAFEIGKKAAIASAVVNGYESAVAAWDAGMSTGGPWAPIVAAAYTAASLARTGATINAIRSQQFSGGGGGASVGGGGGGSATANINAATTPVNTGGGGSPLEVKFTGIQADRNYSGREISSLYDQLVGEAGNRGVRLLPMGS